MSTVLPGGGSAAGSSQDAAVRPAGAERDRRAQHRDRGPRRAVSGSSGKPKNTLYAWHSRGEGPRAIRVGNTLRYRRSEVERWLEDHTDAER
ncbi:helix-turn-helix transcriptional regulator [Micromonospora tulbaghiae]|uniref:helix-turn-helix transcriptional regulator n=1 Tax=Micromonospora tulbaghiae TaxID=479978 RepID=UPI003418A766